MFHNIIFLNFFHNVCSSSEDEREDITDQECDAALMEFIAGTDFDKLLNEDFEMR